MTKPDPLQSASPAAADDVIVDVRDVHYSVDGRAIFSNLNITVRRGRITAVMGPSGTGKTTLMRLITGQIFADTGQVVVLGRDVEKATSSEIYALRKRMGAADFAFTTMIGTSSRVCAVCGAPVTGSFICSTLP